MHISSTGFKSMIGSICTRDFGGWLPIETSCINPDQLGRELVALLKFQPECQSKSELKEGVRTKGNCSSMRGLKPVEETPGIVGSSYD